MGNKNKPVMDSFPLTSHYMLRPRIDDILDRSTRCKLVYVIAGAGYGKTQAVHHYLQRQSGAVVRWLQLNESDNIGSHYWENLVRSISFDNPELAVKLRELGFPETMTHFNQFAGIIKEKEHHTNKTFLVLDDFHLIRSPQALEFAERCAHLRIPGACVIIISRKEPEINTVSLFSKGDASIITEDELRFTEDEIIEYFKQREIQFLKKDIPKIAESTKGWALAIKLLSLILSRRPDDLDSALGATKQNIFKLLETEAFGNLPETVQRRLVKLSLTPDLPLMSIDETLSDSVLDRHEPQLATFIWFDSFINDYRIHPIYLEFLQSKQHILSDDEKHDVYCRVSQWCFSNEFFTDAIKYCALSKQYGRMLEALMSYPFKMPTDTSEYFLNIIQEIDPDDVEDKDLGILVLKTLFIPILLMGADRYKEAEEHSHATIKRWESINTPVSYLILAIANSNLAYAGIYTSTYTYSYDSPAFLKRSLEYHKLSGLPPSQGTGAFLVADIRSFSCTVGESAELADFDKFLESAKETALYVAETSHRMYHGYDDLVACEIAFFKNQPESARKFAHSAILKALEQKQYSIASMANGYLLRLSISEADYPLCKEILKQMEKYPDSRIFWNRHALYDLFTGFFYTQIGLPQMVASWLTLDEKETKKEVSFPINELIVSAKCYIALKNYKQALAILCNSYPREPMHRYRLGELTLSLLLSFVQLKTGDIESAIENFEKAYTLSYEGIFEMPFIELGKDFNALSVATSKREGCTIPVDWLKTTGRKASAYSKKAAIITASMKREKQIEDAIKLSQREREILDDLYHGLSRDEMAAMRYLSINTVNKILQSLFIKLDANNSIDAIRVAIDRNLIE